MFGRLALMLTLAVYVPGCTSANSLTDQMSDARAAQEVGEKLSVGRVQRSIEVGMSSADVVSVLGSPNLVTTDNKRRESWVYDKVSTEAMITSSQGISLFSPRTAKGAAIVSQKTLTIVIKFDGKGRVRDYAYHQSKF